MPKLEKPEALDATVERLVQEMNPVPDQVNKETEKVEADRLQSQEERKQPRKSGIYAAGGPGRRMRQRRNN